MKFVRNLIDVINDDFAKDDTTFPKSKVILASGISLVTALLEAFGYTMIMRLLGHLVADGTSTSVSKNSVGVMAAWASMVFSMRILLQYLTEQLMLDEQVKNASFTREKIIGTTIALNKKSFDSLKLGPLQYLFVHSSSIASALIPTYRRLFLLGAMILGYIVAMCWMQPLFAALAVVMGLLMSRISVILAKESADSDSKLDLGRRNFSTSFVEIFQFAPLVRMLGIADQETKKAEFAIKEFSSVERERQCTHARLRAVQEILAILSVLFLAWLYHFLATRGFVASHSGIMAFFLIQHRMANASGDLYRSWRSILDQRGHKRRIVDHLQSQSEQIERDNEVGRELNCARLKIELRDICYCYENKQPLFQNINLQFVADRRYAIVGPSGTGKTTIINLISRLLRPSAGEIFVNDEPLTALSLKWWRSQIALVGQETFLRNETIRDTISYAVNREIEDEEVWKILSLVELDKLVSGFAEKLDFKIGEGGSKLSLGQKVRLSMARALIRRPKLIILDEALSAVDMEQEKRILNRIYESFSDAVIIVVTHRDPVKMGLTDVVDLKSLISKQNAQISAIACSSPGQSVIP